MAATLKRRIGKAVPAAVLTAGLLGGTAAVVTTAAAAPQHPVHHVVAMMRVYHRG